MATPHDSTTDRPTGQPPLPPGRQPAGQPATRGLGRLLSAPRFLILATLVLALVSALGLRKLRNEDDVLVFLPEGEPEVTVFKDVARRFGALRVALIGATPRDGEVFSGDFLNRLARLSDALKNTTGVDRVVSLSTMTDLRTADGGVDVQALIPTPLPTETTALAKLKEYSLGLSQVRGNVLSADGRSTLVMVFFSDGAKTNALAGAVRTLAQVELGSVAQLYYGGAPFAGPAIYEDTQRDVRRLTPMAMALFFAIVLLAFRGVLPVVLTVVTVALSGVLVLGLMGAMGEAFTVVTGTLPLILFASGSQYAIHILGRYYLLRGESAQGGDGSDSYASRLASAQRAIAIAGPPVAVAAANCALGFLSFAVMNISAMRSFGYACSLGVTLCLLFAVSLLPAVVARYERGTTAGEAAPFVGMGALMLRLFGWARRHRIAVAVTSLIVVAVCGAGILRVQVRMEPRAFFRPGSEPALAQRFLDEAFGGAQFVQIWIERADGGDLTDPRALAELRRLAGYARSLPGVTQVQSIVEPLSLVSASMVGITGLPQRQSQVEQLLFFLEGEPSLRTLFTADRKAALLHVRVLGEAAPVLDGLSTYLRGRWPFRLRRATAADLADELSFLLPAAERAARLPAITSAVSEIQARAAREITPQSDDAALQAAQTAAVGSLSQALARPAGGALQLVAGELLLPPQDEPGPEVTLRGQLTGEPLLDRAFSRAVERNQWLSLGVALSAVLVALLFAQRALWPAVLSLLPALLSLLVVFGSLGFSGRPIDLGTSLVGSIVTSSGADFAMHYIWYLLRRPARDVVPTVGPVIFTTAALLGLGMGVLMLGAAPALRLFGGLACAGLLLSALFTFLLVPALLPLPAALNNAQESSR